MMSFNTNFGYHLCIKNKTKYSRPFARNVKQKSTKQPLYTTHTDKDSKQRFVLLFLFETDHLVVNKLPDRDTLIRDWWLQYLRKRKEKSSSEHLIHRR